MFNIKSIIYACILALLTLTSATSAAAIAGKVIMASGTVTATNALGTERTLQRRSVIDVQDTLTTGENSRVQIRFVDNALLTLQPNSQLHIEEYQLAQDNAADGKVLMNLVEGGFRSLTGTIGKGTPEAYKVNTPAASIGIRGTLFSAMYRNKTLFAGVWQGGISLTTPTGGQYNLGLDSSYQFGQINAAGFTGLLEASAELDVAPNAEDNADNSADDTPSSGSATNSPAHSNTNTAPAAEPDSALLLNTSPAEQWDEEETQKTLKENSEEKHTIDPFITFITSLKEQSQNNNSIAYAAIGNDTKQGYIFAGDGDKFDRVFYLGSDNTPILYGLHGVDELHLEASPNSSFNLGALADQQVFYGMWNTNDNKIDALNIDSAGKIMAEEIDQNLYWVSAPGIELTENLTSQFNFGVVAMAGQDWLGGNLLASDSYGYFDLDLANGAIQNGQLGLIYENSFWNASFKGELINGQFSMRFEDGGIENATATFNPTNSTLQGTVFGSNQQPDGAISVHNLKATHDINNEEIWANGILVWEARVHVP